MTTGRSDLMRPGLASLAAGFLLMAAVASATIWFVRAEQANREFARHSVDTEKQLYLLETLLLDSETGQRGYLLTGDDAYLAPYDLATASIGQTLTDIGIAVTGNPKQTQALMMLRRVAGDKLSELRATIDKRRAGHLDEATAIVREGTGKALMEQARATIARMIETENRLVVESRAEAVQSGFRLQISVLAAAVLLGVVAISTLLFFLRQIKDVVASRDALHAANDRLVAEVAQRELLEEQLRQSQKMEALGQLTGGLAHDFNNMLAVILGSLDLLERGYARRREDLKRFIDAAVEGAQRAAVLTQRLLAFSRQQPLAPQPIDANKFVAGMSGLLRHTLGGEVRLETVLAGGLWRSHADPSQLENAILNLAINARDAMPGGGRLTIETGNAHLDDAYAARHAEVPAGQYVMVAVTDSGAGMAPEIISKAFDPFFTTKGPGKGTGLGLSQVYGFVKQSKGHVKIYSEPGHGTTVRLYLPRFFGSDEPAAPQPLTTNAVVPPPGNVEEIILAVEDEEQVRQMTVETLSELGYTVLQADGAAAALRILDSRPDVSLLFTDIVMPDVNGRKLADEARLRRPGLKVLYTTGYTRNAIVHNGMLDPGVDLVTKPFTLQQLAIKVRDVLSRD